MITHFWSFSFGFFTNHNIWSFLNNISHFEIGAWNFWYFNIENKSLAFWAPYISMKSCFPFFLVCVMAFAAHYLFSFLDLHLLSSLSKNIKKCRKIYRHRSMHVSKPTKLLTNHKLEDRFTTVTYRFQDFSHKDRCVYIIS